MRVLTVVALTVLTTTAVRSQEPTFDGVSVLLTVLDRDGAIVPNLQRQDFTVLDDGKRQDIVFFQNQVQPFTVVVLMDVSFSMSGNRKAMTSAAERFIENLSPEDRVQVGVFTDTLIFNSRFTSDRGELVRALGNTPPGSSSRLYDALNESIDRLAGAGRHKAVLVFSDGLDTASQRHPNDVLTKARNQGVIVYTIGVQPDLGTLGQRALRERAQTSALRRLAEETGGGYFELTKPGESGSAFARIAQEMRSAYVVGFTPAKRDGKQHKLEIRARPGMSVRARRGYLAPSN